MAVVDHAETQNRIERRWRAALEHVPLPWVREVTPDAWYLGTLVGYEDEYDGGLPRASREQRVAQWDRKDRWRNADVATAIEFAPADVAYLLARVRELEAQCAS